MSRKSKIGLFLGLAAVGGVGYLIGRFAVPPPACPPCGGAGEAMNIGQLARNARSTCQVMTPLLTRIEQAYANGRLSPDELLSILGNVGQLV